MPNASVRLAAIWGALSAVATLMLLRGFWFYTGSLLNDWGETWTVVGLIVIAIAYVIWAPDHVPHDMEEEDAPHTLVFKVMEAALASVALIGFMLIARAAAQASTVATIRTPWPLMPWWTLPLIGLLWALVLASAWRLRRTHLTVLQTACAIGATVVIAPLLYTIGYGFDGFLHVAGETVLAKTGTLLPKPPYYMGQYVFVTWLSGLFDVDIGFLDRWLVPVAAMTMIPGALYVAARKWNVHSGALMIASLILMPLGAYVATTPHGFATVLAVVALLLAIGSQIGSQQETSRMDAVPPLFALWSTLTHPLVGLPILCATVMHIFWQAQKTYPWMRWLTDASAIVAGISVPVIFGLASGLGSAAGVEFDLSKLFAANTWNSILSGFIPWVPNRFALWPEASVWVEKLLPWLAVVFAGLAIIRGRRDTGRDASRPYAPWGLAAGSTFFAALVLQMAGDFGFLIDYERGNYAARLFMVAWLLLLPLAIPELARRLEMIARAPFIHKLATLLAMGLLGAGASYAALPRHDAVTPSRGWSVGSADLEAVKLIEQDAAGRPYTVLANQSVSAAAVKTFGFKRYNNDVFFYPIPTGGALYDVFLRASYEDPSRETMREAARLGGSDLVYFVVNDYWWKAPELSEAASSSTDRTFVIQDGKVNVFKYDLK